jgi:hypothetical protein
MIIAFTQSRTPSWFSKLIAKIDGSPYTHVVAYTGLKLPTGDELVFHSQWNSGLTIAPASVVVGNKLTLKFDDECVFDWREATRLLRSYAGIQNYGWTQMITHLLTYLGFKNTRRY